MIPGAIACLLATLLAMLFDKKERGNCLGCIGVIVVIAVVGFLYLASR